jgi:hypothetical protein
LSYPAQSWPPPSTLRTWPETNAPVGPAKGSTTPHHFVHRGDAVERAAFRHPRRIDRTGGDEALGARIARR